MSEIINIFPTRDFSMPTNPPLIIKGDKPRKALLMDGFRVGFKVGGTTVILTNGYGAPEWRYHTTAHETPGRL